MSISFIKEAVAIACAESHVHKYADELFELDISFHGRMKSGGGSVMPWRDEDPRHHEMYVKKVFCVYIRINNGFDSYARIFDQSASLQGFFKSDDAKYERIVCQVDTCRWTNLLLENGFLDIKL